MFLQLQNYLWQDYVHAVGCMSIDVSGTFNLGTGEVGVAIS